jgi:heptose-I-phosphate ethanolaminephosphotransferase
MKQAIPTSLISRLQAYRAVSTASSFNLFLIFLFLGYFSMAPQFLFAVKGLAGWSGLKDALLYSIPWLLVPLLLPKFTRYWLLLMGFIIGLMGCVKIGYYALYGQEISQSVFMSTMETTPQEALEFLQIYFHWWIPVLLFVFTLPVLLLYVFIRVPEPSPRQRKVLLSVITLLLAGPFLTHLDDMETAQNRFFRRHQTVEPWGMLQSYTSYKANLAESSQMLDKMKDVTHKAAPIKLIDPQQKQTYVMVIGESTNRQRLGLYGYSRDTSPQLQSLRDELLIYPDVVSAIPYTIESLSTALTFAGLSDFKRAFSHMNVVTLMQRAGFKVIWITNQQTLSSRNTLLTAFANLSDDATFLNNNRRQSARQPDDVVFEPFKKALTDKAEKKLIIVHLLGTHFAYEFRYPESVTTFDGQKPPASSKVESTDDLAKYNQYDNAVLYNDFVVAQLIKDYRQQDPYGALLYFSDHGEEVFDVQHFNGRNGGLPSTNMYTVPFLMWASPSWQKQRDMAALKASTHNAYSLSWLLHGWCDLVKIDYAECKPEHSVFSANFKPVTRWIGASIGGKPSDFDRMAARENEKVVADAESAKKLLLAKTLEAEKEKLSN